jgi:pterin-4a-carbinolamine dehydratase
MAVTKWDLEGETLVRKLTFRDFNQAFAFAAEVAEGAVDWHRRPDMTISRNTLRLAVYNLHHAGITLAERRLAAKVDAVIEAHMGMGAPAT